MNGRHLFETWSHQVNIVTIGLREILNPGEDRGTNGVQLHLIGGQRKKSWVRQDNEMEQPEWW